MRLKWWIHFQMQCFSWIIKNKNEKKTGKAGFCEAWESIKSLNEMKNQGLACQ